uniref:Uncharacterized protein n=1 Tax=Rhizophora mucronata TaxID=61149 RepID=A0A2P2QTH4_RHIMU
MIVHKNSACQYQVKTPIQ